MKLSDVVDKISDAFQSTFTVVDENTLANMLGLKGDFKIVTNIIKRYMPDVTDVRFEKTGELDTDYDIYLIHLERETVRQKETHEIQ